MSDNLQVMYGKQTFSHTNCSVVVSAYGAKGQKTFPSRLLPALNTVKMLAAQDGYEDHGIWFTTTLKHSTDLILSIKLAKYVHSACHAHCMLFLRLRKGGDLIQVDIKPPLDAMAVNETLPVFTGHADVLSVEEVEGMGVNLSAGVKRNYVDPEDVAAEFSVQSIKKGAPRPDMRTVETKEGKKTVVVKKQPNRRIRIPSKK